jgi:Fe-S cluster assembly protein SufD
MNVGIRHIRTAAEQELVDAFADVKATLPGAKQVATLREAAFSDFQSRGLPHRRVEEWKYTDLRALMRDAKPLAGVPDARAKSRALARAKEAQTWLAAARARRIVIVDGVFAADLSDLADLEKGLRIHSLSEALASGRPDIVNPLGAPSSMSGDPAVGLNTMFMGDGAVIHVETGVKIERPIHILHVTASEKAVATFTRSVVTVGAGAQVTLIEDHEGPAGVDYQVNHVLELAVGADAQVARIKINREGDKALHVATLLSAVEARAKVNDFSFQIGGAVVRNQIAVRFEGEGIDALIGGACLLKGRQHVDNTMVIDHAVGHCTGRELFKSVLDDESRAVFQGKIIVRQDAQKTDGKMASHALLLSEEAEADHKPELEIFADDVVCGHGATAGALDEDLLFYLRARGIPKQEAEALMIQAFIGEAVEGVADEAVREALMQAVRDWLQTRA